jgi:hypothetical protein
MAHSPVNIKDYIQSGGNLIVGPGSHSPINLKVYAQLAVQHNVQLTIDCTNQSPVTVKDIIKTGGSNVTVIV